jgi:hypothetical protein
MGACHDVAVKYQPVLQFLRVQEQMARVTYEASISANVHELLKMRAHHHTFLASEFFNPIHET